MADHPPVLLPQVGGVVRPILIKFLLDKEGMVVVWEILFNRVKRVFQEISVASLASGQVEVDQVGWGVVADGVPVLFALVRAQSIAARVKRNRIEVREIAPLGPVEVESVEQLNR